MIVSERGPSPNSRARRAPAVTAVVIHDTGSRDAESAIGWLLNPASGVSAHYVVGRDGAVYNLVPEMACAFHAGASELHGVPNVNEYSIGIEVVDADDRGGDPYPEPQLAALAELVAACCLKYGIRLNRVVGHADVATPRGRKVDPGPDFPWADFLLRVARRLA